MKAKFLMALLFACLTSYSFAQGDTTKIKMKNKKIIIIDEKEGQKGAELEFKRNILQLQDSILKLRKMNDSASVLKEQRADLESKISDLEKQLEAYNKGLEDLVGGKENENDLNFKFEYDNKDDSDKNKEHKRNRLNRNLNRFVGHWQGVGFGFDALMSNSGGFSLPDGTNGDVDGRFLDHNVAKSNSWSFDLIQGCIPLVGKRFGIVTGLGIQSQGFSLNDNYVLSKDAKGKTVGVLDTINYSKNTFTTWYLNVPVLLELNSQKGFFINMGVLFGLRTGSNQKLEYEINGKDIDLKASSDYNLNPFRCAAYASVGYKHIGVYAQYQMNQMFKVNKGPDVYPMSVGVKLIF